MRLKVGNMKIVINGEEAEFGSELTILDLLIQRDLNREGGAVALNRSVIPRTEHATTMIREGDKVEVIHAVGGG